MRKEEIVTELSLALGLTESGLAPGPRSPWKIPAQWATRATYPPLNGPGPAVQA